MDDENEIIYIALCNSINMYSSILENEDLEDKEKDIYKYIISRQLSILDKYEANINGNPIKRPQWNKDNLI